MILEKMERIRMKKIICLFTAFLLCLGLATPAFAEEFVPSVGVKDAPSVVEVVIIDEDGNVVREIGDDCLFVTSLSAILAGEEGENDHHNENFDLLLSVYNQLKDGTMKLPYEKFNAGIDAATMVIRDLFDATLICTDEEEPDCEPNSDENCADVLEPAGVRIRITFDLGVSRDTTVYTMSYKEEAWQAIPTVNNGDGTVTCTFEHLCPVVFSVREGSDSNSPNTGDPTNVLPWVVLLTVSAAGLVTLLVFKRKRSN